MLDVEELTFLINAYLAPCAQESKTIQKLV